MLLRQARALFFVAVMALVAAPALARADAFPTISKSATSVGPDLRRHRSSRDTEPEELQRRLRAIMDAIVQATVRIDTEDGMGSGTIIDTAGHIVTSAHVIEGSRIITVTLVDGRRFEARLLGINSAGDLALLDIDADNLKPARLGDSATLRKQQWVVASGHPVSAFDDFQPTVSIGLIRRLDAVIRADRRKLFRSAIVSDTPLSSGSSGGGLFDLQGRLVGVNAAVTRSERGSFSVRINEFLRDRERLLKGEHFDRIAAQQSWREGGRDRTSRSRIQYFTANCEDVAAHMSERQVRMSRGRDKVTGLIVSSQGAVLAPARFFKDDAPGTLVSVRIPGSHSRRDVARLVAVDRTNGVALLSLPRRPLGYSFYDLNRNTPVERGQLALAKSGAWLNGGVVASAHRVPPLTMTNAVYYPHVIQVDLRMSQSDRGAPVVNLKGRLLGMVVQPRLQEYGDQDGPAPFGAFLLPVSLLRESYGLLSQGQSRGRRPVGFLGVQLDDLTEAQKARRHVQRGVLIARSVPGYPAYEAGIRSGDILTAIGPVEATTKGSVQARIASCRRGDQVTVTVSRRGEVKQFEVTIMDRSDLVSARLP